MQSQPHLALAFIPHSDTRQVDRQTDVRYKVSRLCHSGVRSDTGPLPGSAVFGPGPWDLQLR